MKSSIANFFAITYALVLASAFAFAQTQPDAAKTGRFFYGSASEPTYSAFVIPLDGQKGVQLHPTSSFPWLAGEKESYYPWFFNIATRSRYLMAPDGENSVSYPLEIKNPIAAFGSSAGGTPLYPGQSYRFGFYAGGQNASTDLPSEATLQIYRKADFTSSGTAQIPILTQPFDLAHAKDIAAGGNTADWKEFGDHGFQRTFVTSIDGIAILETTIQFVMGDVSDSMWGVKNKAPLLITHRALEGAVNFYFVVNYTGVTRVGTRVAWMAVNDPALPENTGDEVPGYAMNFDSFPAWGSTLLKTPNFQGNPAPPAYYGKTADEIAEMAPRFDVELVGRLKNAAGQIISAPPSGQYINLNGSAATREHPLLNKLVTELGNNPLSIVNYVQNEIGLTDALGYNETGDLDEQAVNAAGMNRDALGTYLEGQGSPDEQCALLVYLLRKAGVQAAYVTPPHSVTGSGLEAKATSPVSMLDQRLSNLLRMRIKGTVSPDGHTPVASLVGVNYPWVVAYLPSDPGNPASTKKWIHLFPWLKDTEVVEGLGIEGYLPGGTHSVREWVRNFILSSKTALPLSLDPENKTPGNIFKKDLEQNLQNNWKGLSLDDIGVRFRDRKFNRGKWDEFPQPCSVDKTKFYTLKEDLYSGQLDDPRYDRMDIKIYSVQNSTNTAKKITLTGLRTMDFHNRRAIVNFKPIGSSTDKFKLTFDLQPYNLTNPAAGTNDFSYTTDSLYLKKQERSFEVDATDRDFVFSVTYHRHRSYAGKIGSDDEAILGGWQSFLGINEFDFGPGGAALAGSEIKSYFKLGDMNAFCMNAGRVTDKMTQVHLEALRKHEQARAKDKNLNPDYYLIRGTTAYLMGMTYYQRVSDSFESLKNLFKIHTVSMRAHGFAQFGAERESGLPQVGTVALPAGGSIQVIQQIYPIVDMNFFRGAWAGYGDLRADAGGQQLATGSDFFTNLMVTEQSSLEDYTIKQYFQKEDADAVSTMDLIQRIQSDNKPNNNVIELTAENYLAYQTKKYSFEDKTRTLEKWLGATTWQEVINAFNEEDQDIVRVYVTPGPVRGAKDKWQGTGILIFGKNHGAALIGQVLNGGYGGPSSFLSSWSGTSAIPAINFLTLNMSGGYPSVSSTTWGTNWSSSSSYPYTSLSNLSITSQPFLQGSDFSLAFENLNPSDVISNMDFGRTFNGSSAVTNSLNIILSSGSVPVGDPRETSGYALSAADPVNMITGEFYADEVDLQLSGPLPLQIRRNYGSQVSSYGNFGYGWKMSYFPYLFLNDEKTKIHAAEMDGSVVVYKRNIANTQVEEWIVDASDNPLLTNGKESSIGSVNNLYHNRIVRTPATTTNNITSPIVYTLFGVDGSQRVYEVKSYPVNGADPPITRERPYLKKWTDSVGNCLDFYFYGDEGAAGQPWVVSDTNSSYGQLALVKASNGNSLGFHYDTTGRILDAYAGDGRRVSYRYDEDGDLREVIYPDASWVRYDYLREQGKVGSSNRDSWYSTHLINRETRPGGRMVETDYQVYAAGDKNEKGNTISSGSWKIGKASHLRRAIRQRATVGEHLNGSNRQEPAVESYKPVLIATFSYFNDAALIYGDDESDRKLVTGRTEITDAYYRKTIYYYDKGRLTKVADPNTVLSNAATGAGSNFKIVQGWYTPADVSGGVVGAWAGGLAFAQERNCARIDYSYSAAGEVTQVKVTGELDGNPMTVNDTAITTASYNARFLAEWVVYPAPVGGLAAGKKTHFFYDDPARPYHITQIDEQSSSGNILRRTTHTYEDVFTVGDNPQNPTKPYSKGIRRRTAAAADTVDEFVTSWTSSPSGFRLSETRYSGISDQANYPDAVTQYDCNLRGEVTEERIMDGSTAKKINRYAYDDMGRKIWVERLDSTRKQVAWDYTYYNKTGEVEWTDSSRTNPEDYTYTRYDGGGRPVEQTAVRSRARAEGTGVEAIPGKEAYSTSKCFYNQFGDLIKTMDGRGNTIKCSYDDLGRPLAKAAYQGDWQKGGLLLSAESITYDDSALSVSSTDARGAVTTTYYTSDKKPWKKINGDGTVDYWTYYLDGRARTEPLSSHTYCEYAYDDVNRIVIKSLKNNSGSLLGTTSQTFDRRGNVVSSTDIAGLITTSSYDKLNRVISSTVSASAGTSAAQTSTFYYDAAGFYQKSVNGLSEITEVTSDVLGRPLSTVVRKPDSTIINRSSNSYSLDFQSVTTTSGSGAGALSSTTWTDHQGKPVLVKYADGRYVRTEYDAVGNAVAVTDETEQTTRSSYDGLNRVATSVMADGGLTSFVYSYTAGGGQRIERRMPGNLTEVKIVDAIGRPIRSYLQGAGNAVSRDYSNYSYYTSGKENGLLKQFTDPNNLVHTITYDQWLRAETSTIGTVGDSRYAKKEFLNYDVRGMFTSLRETTTPSGTSQTQVTQVDRSYDIQGHLYDEKVSLGENAGSLAVATHLTETFDAAGRRVSLARGSTVSAMGAAKAGLWGFSYRADGLLESVSSEGGTFASSYGDNGLLVNRSNPFRTHTVSNRDNRGRVLGANVSLAGASVSLVAEAIGWTNDSKQASYSATRLSSADGSGIATWTDSRAYSYGIQRRQLTSESYIPVSGQPSKSIDYEFDHDLKGGLGIRTLSYSRSGNSLQAHQVGGDANGNGWDAFGRVTYEISGYEKVGLSVQGTAPGAKSVSLRVGDNGALDGVDYPVATSSTSGAWGRNLALPSGGGFTLNGDAAHPSGLFSATASSSFSLAIRHFGVVNSYNAEGSLTARSIAGGFSVGGRSQTLTWDGVGRLVKVVQDETAGFGFTWTAVYDGLNRRIETKTKWDGTATGLGQASQQDVVQRSWYDPLVEFLEVGLQVTRFNRAGAVTSNERWWKVHGPDLSGGYGGLQGMGGLEAMINESTGEAVGMIDDAYGTILGFSKALNPGKAPGYSYSTAIKAFEWNVSRFGGYGPLPGQWAPALEDSTAVWRTYGWRGKRIDVTGFYAMGARYYEPNSGRFISPDPLGHAASMGLYDYAGGDPINFVDPRGRNAMRPGSAAWTCTGSWTGEAGSTDWLTQVNSMGDDYFGFWTGVGQGVYGTVTGVVKLAYENNPARNIYQLSTGQQTQWEKNFNSGVALLKYGYDFATSSDTRTQTGNVIANSLVEAWNDPVKFGSLSFHVVTTAVTVGEGAVNLGTWFSKTAPITSLLATEARTVTTLESGGAALTFEYNAAKSVATPYGAALQSEAAAAAAARAQVSGGSTLYRVGTTGRSAAGEAQFWALEHPSSPGFASRYGLPAENVTAADFIETATLRPGTPFVTRPAPGIGTNPGGGIEVVVPSGGVRLDSFHYSPNILEP